MYFFVCVCVQYAADGNIRYIYMKLKWRAQRNSKKNTNQINEGES